MSLLGNRRKSIRVPGPLLAVALPLLLCSMAAAWAQGRDVPPADDPGVAKTPSVSAKAAITVFVDGKVDKLLRAGLADRMARIGEDAEPADDLDSLNDCREAVCVKEHIRADRRVLIVHISTNGNRRYFLEGLLMEPNAGSLRTAQTACEECSNENLRGVLGDLASQLLVHPAPSKPQNREPGLAAAPPPRSPPTSAGATAVAPAAQTDKGGRRVWTPRKIALLALLSGAALATLTTTLVLTASSFPYNKPHVCLMEDAPPDKPIPFCWSAVGLVTAGFAVTAVLGGGIGLAATWGDVRPPAASPSVTSPLSGVLP